MVQIVVNERVLKIDAKSVKKGACRSRDEKRHGGRGALLEYKKTRFLSNKTLDQTRPGVPSGTVADIYI